MLFAGDDDFLAAGLSRRDISWSSSSDRPMKSEKLCTPLESSESSSSGLGLIEGSRYFCFFGASFIPLSLSPGIGVISPSTGTASMSSG